LRERLVIVSIHPVSHVTGFHQTCPGKDRSLENVVSSRNFAFYLYSSVELLEQYAFVFSYAPGPSSLAFVLHESQIVVVYHIVLSLSFAP